MCRHARLISCPRRHEWPQSAYFDLSSCAPLLSQSSGYTQQFLEYHARMLESRSHSYIAGGTGPIRIPAQRADSANSYQQRLEILVRSAALLVLCCTLGGSSAQHCVRTRFVPSPPPHKKFAVFASLGDVNQLHRSNRSMPAQEPPEPC